MILESLIKKFLRRRQNQTNLKHYSEIGNSIDRGIRIRLDNPVNRKYLFVGDNCIINGNFIFESQDGIVSIGNHTYIGGGTFISHSGIEIGNNVTIAWGGVYL